MLREIELCEDNLVTGNYMLIRTYTVCPRNWNIKMMIYCGVIVKIHRDISLDYSGDTGIQQLNNNQYHWYFKVQDIEKVYTWED